MSSPRGCLTPNGEGDRTSGPPGNRAHHPPEKDKRQKTKLPFGPLSRSVHTGLSLSAPPRRPLTPFCRDRRSAPPLQDPTREPALQRGTQGTHLASPGSQRTVPRGHEVKSPRQGQTFPPFFFWRKNRME